MPKIIDIKLNLKFEFNFFFIKLINFNRHAKFNTDVKFKLLLLKAMWFRLSPMKEIFSCKLNDLSKSKLLNWPRWYRIESASLTGIKHAASKFKINKK